MHRCLTPRSGAGGCDFAARPGLSALAQDVHWSPAADPAVLMLTATPDILASTSAWSPAHPDEARDSEEGLYAILGASVVTQVVLLKGTAASDPLAALVPLDGDLPG